MPDQFQASARVVVDTQSLLRPALGGLALDTSGIQQQQVALMTRTLLSRRNLEKLARITDLDLRAKGPEEMESLLNTLGSKIGISADRGQPNLYNRPLYLAAVLLASLGGGVAFALFLALTKPTFDDRRVLGEMTGLPVYGAVSMVWTMRQKLRNRLELAGFSFASLFLLAGYRALNAKLLLFDKG